MNPFGEQEALALAQELGYGQGTQAQEALQSLLKQVPCYPLTLVQLLSTLEAEGLDAAEFLEAMQQYTATRQEQALITLLDERPQARGRLWPKHGLCAENKPRATIQRRAGGKSPAAHQPAGLFGSKRDSRGVVAQLG